VNTTDRVFHAGTWKAAGNIIAIRRRDAANDDQIWGNWQQGAFQFSYRSVFPICPEQPPP